MVHCLPIRWVIPQPPPLLDVAGSERFQVRVQVPERAPASNEAAAHATRMKLLTRTLTPMSQLSAARPRPLAFEAILERRGNPPQVYNRELRNPIWAQAMEASINSFLSECVLSRFPGLAAEVECRTSTARVTLTVSEALRRGLETKYSPAKADVAIATEVAESVGPFAYAYREVVMPDRAVSFALAFDDEGMSPEDYRDRQKRLVSEFRRRR